MSRAPVGSLPAPVVAARPAAWSLPAPAPTPEPVTPEEPPVIAIAAPTTPVDGASLPDAALFAEKLDRVARRSATALEAWEAKVAADTAFAIADEAAAAADRTWQEARRQLEAAAVDVGLVSHAIAAVEEPVEPDGGPPDGPANIPETIPGEVEDDAPEVVTRRADSEPVGLPGLTAAETRREAAGGDPRPTLGRQQQRILDAVTAARGDRHAAARSIGTNEKNVTTTLHQLGKRGLLPIDLIPQLPAGFAKYSGL